MEDKELFRLYDREDELLYSIAKLKNELEDAESELDEVVNAIMELDRWVKNVQNTREHPRKRKSVLYTQAVTLVNFTKL